jgi:hypothetical protein
MFDFICDRSIILPGVLVGIFAADGIVGIIVAFPMVGAFIVAFGIAAAVLIGIAAVVFIVGVTIFVAIGLIVGVTVAAVDTAVMTTINDARTTSTNAIFNILIPKPPQYPLCRATHQ